MQTVHYSGLKVIPRTFMQINFTYYFYSNQAIGISKFWQNRIKPWKVLQYSVVKIIECNYKSPFEI